MNCPVVRCRVGTFEFSVSGAGSGAGTVLDLCVDLARGAQPSEGRSTTEFELARDSTGCFVVRVDHRSSVAFSRDDATVGSDFFGYLNPQVVNAHSGWSVFHGGAVELPAGALITFGLSGAGKSTLTAALTMAGAGYLTDEAALVEPITNLVHPYAKPLSLNRDSLILLGVVPPPGQCGEESALRPGDLGGRAASAPVPLWGLCEVVPAHGQPIDVGQLGPAAAIMAMLPSYMCFDPRRDALVELAVLAQRIPIWRVRGGHPADQAAALMELADRPVAAVGAPDTLDCVVERTDAAPREAAHVGPFSAPARIGSLSGACFVDGAVVLDRSTGEHVRMSPRGFEVLARLDGSAGLCTIAGTAGLDTVQTIDFVRSLADRGWLQGYQRQVDLPVHPHVAQRGWVP